MQEKTGGTRLMRAIVTTVKKSRFKILVTATVLFAVSLTLEGMWKSYKYGVNPFTVANAKTTPLNKYISSEKTFELTSANPNILFIDVRDPIEIARSGHPKPVDAIVPIRLQSDRFDQNLQDYSLVENPHFLQSMKRVLDLNGKSKHDMIIITCGSGRRSAKAVQKLVAAGYTDVWHIPDGYEGDEKPGINTKNAWQMSGLPWETETTVTGSEWIKLIDDK